MATTREVSQCPVERLLNSGFEIRLYENHLGTVTALAVPDTGRHVGTADVCYVISDAAPQISDGLTIDQAVRRLAEKMDKNFVPAPPDVNRAQALKHIQEKESVPS